MPAHSLISPSSSDRWGFCSGAPALEAQYPEKDKTDGDEGTASHWIASEVLSNSRPAAACWDYLGLTAFNGILIDEYMVESAAVYVEEILGVSVADLMVEQLLPIPSIHSECFGTPDCWYYDAATGTLYIWDYKYGWGLVEAFENPQFICYYAGILDKLGLPDTAIRVVFTLVQPRPYHPEGPVRQWVLPAVELRPYVNRLNNAAHQVYCSPLYVSGPHCRYCLGRHTCLSGQKAAMYSVDIATTDAPREFTPEELGKEWMILDRAEKAIKYRKTAIEVPVLELIKLGTRVPGCGTARGRGSHKWKKEDAEIFALGDLMGVELRKDPTPATPNQAKTKGISEDLINTYSEKTPGKLKLVPDTKTLASRVFTRKTGE